MDRCERRDVPIVEPKVGDEVRVVSHDPRQPAGGWPGRVEKVGRKLLTIRYDGGTSQFEKTSRRIRDGSGNVRFQTMHEADLDRRYHEAVATLRFVGIGIDVGRRVPLDLLETLAREVKRSLGIL